MGKEFSIDQMQALMECVAKNRIGEFQYEEEGVKLRIKNWMMAPAAQPPVQPPMPVPAMAVAVPQPQVQPETQAAPAAAEQPAQPGTVVTSPLVGTYYASSSPDSDPFVTVGQHVKKGDVLFIIESMKVMNEVPADTDGVVAAILVDNGAAVEYGQPILRLE